ncbi:MAG: GIY-YIG nuclease family protein, partial [bacterium]|nr:GIY-YIG nuclease family protein [bacterium]
MEEKQFAVYLMSNHNNTTIYTGVTGKGLKLRVWEHKQKLVKGFTNKYNVTKLVYYVVCDDPYT